MTIFGPFRDPVKPGPSPAASVLLALLRRGPRSLAELRAAGLRPALLLLAVAELRDAGLWPVPDERAAPPRRVA